MENAAAAKASPYAIELDGCTFCYKGASRPSLRDVSLKIPRGQCVVVTGQSGCGKTTLTRLVNALIPLMYEGDLQGEVLVAGKLVSSNQCAALSFSLLSGLTSSFIFSFRRQTAVRVRQCRRVRTKAFPWHARNAKNHRPFTDQAFKKGFIPRRPPHRAFSPRASSTTKEGARTCQRLS